MHDNTEKAQSADGPTWVITTLAEYQTEFWRAVCRELTAAGQDVFVLAFDDRSAEMLSQAGIAHANVYRMGQAALGDADIGATFAARMDEYGVVNSALLLSHERAAFRIRDAGALQRKFVIYAAGIEAALKPLEDAGRTIKFIQELGGFLSVLAAFRIARRRGYPTIFIEPSFFRGRMFLQADTLAAPRVGYDARIELGGVVRDYLADTLKSRKIVIPVKDRGQYNPVYKKIFNRHNLRRLVEKFRDKYLLGKHQDFGYLRHHVRHHLAMLRTSRRLARFYSPVPAAGSFIYYPLHVPADVALTLRSPEYLDQFALIEFILRTAPPNHVLVIKEHPAQIGAVNYHRVADLMHKYDNLRLLAPSHNNFGVLERAALVISVNSKSGAEAILLGKHVIVMGDAFYADAPFVTKVENLRDLPGAMAAALETSAPDRAVDVGRYFQAIYDKTFPGELYVNEPSKITEFSRSLAQGLARLDVDEDQ